MHCVHRMELLPTPLQKTAQGYQISWGHHGQHQKPGTWSSSCLHGALYFPCHPSVPWARRCIPPGFPQWTQRSFHSTPVRNSCKSASSTRMKSSGLRTEPWHTLTPIPNSTLYGPLTCTQLWALEYMPWMTPTAHFLTPRLLKAHHSTLFGPWSRAFSRSTKAK